MRTGGLAVAGLVAAAALSVVAPADTPEASPSQRFGELFDAVQMRRLFADGKTFADAVPKRPAARIEADYVRGRPWTDAQLLTFVRASFTLPDGEPPSSPSADRPPLAEHIRTLWDRLARDPAVTPPESSAVALPARYVVPGGRFRELYYWDSYFTMLGLARDGRDDLVEGMVADFGSLIERFGHVPNGTRTYYLARSQPPVFYLMLGLSKARDRETLRRRLAQLRREHAFWMAGAGSLRPGEAADHVVRMPDGALLNRYWGGAITPRDESWREDVLTARAAAPRPAGGVYRDLRAAAESGWDFSSRWLGDGRALATIRTTAIVPVDLNALLYGMEREIGRRCGAAGDSACAADFSRRAAARRTAIGHWLWSRAEGRFADYDRQDGRRTAVLSAATLFPLFTGAATRGQADAVARTVARRLTAPGGLRTTTSATGQQWDRPNGWAPLQWIAAVGLDRYGHRAEADRIARTFLGTVAREYRASGRMLEKYDVEEIRPGGGGEYPTQDGFGWTNGVTRALIDRVGMPR